MMNLALLAANGYLSDSVFNAIPHDDIHSHEAIFSDLVHSHLCHSGANINV